MYEKKDRVQWSNVDNTKPKTEEMSGSSSAEESSSEKDFLIIWLELAF